MVERPRGTRDFYPNEMRLRSWLFDKFHAASKAHGFEEYDSPILEYEELYTRKQGEEITQQLFNFEDKGGRKVSLRPEMTPSLARMVMAQAKTLPLPLKWYSIPQCWRYERTQRGRGREHYQWNVDIWGTESISADAELISIMVHFFKSVELTEDDLVIKISSRKVIEEVLGTLGIQGERFTQTCIIVDKMDKLPPEVIESQLAEIGLDQNAVTSIQNILGIKQLDELEKQLGKQSEAVQELRSLFMMLESYQILQWVEFDASIVRGLAYYTGPVFEAHDRNGQLRAICGGGRYNRLLSSLGGHDLPASGFGFGDMVIMELLKERELLPNIPSGNQDVVIPLNEDLRPGAMIVASKLRRGGRSVDVILENKKLKWAFRHADRIGADRLVMVMPDEWVDQKVKVKNLNNGEEKVIPIEDL